MGTHIKNQVKLSLLSINENVSFARAAAAAFSAQVDLTITDIDEIKVAVSEAVSNAVIHGYGGNNHKQNFIELVMNLYRDKLEFFIIDFGKGIANIEEARQPSFSSDPERMGLGFVFMDSFMDELEIISKLGQGTTVKMVKLLVPSTEH
ncbi:anti-sigma F factor [Sporomusa acidovorans]|uniref:Anti-sigma F factor n=1 Tax=Sporomusa acidovorans (strain ATCC 49682 / DSM 3132 / Mol) TaxID=1123286 RepID=A0ABZ3J3M9_SPOA4|nr:anti-sigma F factor [Sporomusa acidovorans]OZC20340.1 anti-sigma F factor [Sporomusa acidovorans DSM 3132]SDD37101.1 stage II sporulation protein AB (anti-sigma F factor) [Sporomusa acidovorans]